MPTTLSIANSASDGFLLLDSEMNPILVNTVAAQILAYPDPLQPYQDSRARMIEKIRSMLVCEQSKDSVLVTRFQSGRRQYMCRCFPMSDMTNEGSQPSLAVILERVATKSTSLVRLSQRFNLTHREQEVAQFLLQGLTSKEIGSRMQISPNTVKTFLRLIMVKMGVSTRSGIVGKALTQHFER